jgi:hypothetical protein
MVLHLHTENITPVTDLCTPNFPKSEDRSKHNNTVKPVNSNPAK